MLLRILRGLFTFFFAFSVGAGLASEKPENTELREKVQEHVDVIVDESAAIVDDLMDEARKDERVQKAEEFIDDVTEIAQNTADDIEAHFGTEECTEEEPEEALEEEAPEETEAAEEETEA